MAVIQNSINNTVGGSNSGVTNQLLVTNSSNTASSAAQVKVSVAGGTADDPTVLYSVDGVTTYTSGIDNSDSDKWKISGAALGTNDYIVVNPGATLVELLSTNLRIARSVSGSYVSAVISNDSNTATSSAILEVSNAGTSALQAVVYHTNSTDGMISGMLASDGSYRIAASNLSIGGASDSFVMTKNGELTTPLQPAFLAYLGSTVTNVTGTGTSYTLGTGTALTEVFDQNSDFNTNGTFTAPVTGRYYLQMRVYCTGCTIASTFAASLVTSNRTYAMQFNKVAGSQDETVMIDILADMDAADTATAVIAVSGEAGDTVDIGGSATVATSFCGWLAC